MGTGPSLRRTGGVVAEVEAGVFRRLREDDTPPVAFRESCLSNSKESWWFEPIIVSVTGGQNASTKIDRQAGS